MGGAPREDLKRAGARGLVLAGETQPPAVHALAHAINEALGAVGTTVVYTEPAEMAGDASLGELVEEMKAGEVEALVITGANPVYAAPADLGFAEALEKVPVRIHHGLSLDETAVRCQWHLPAAHPLESWSDARAIDGTVSIVQPLIAPLYGGLSRHELVAAFIEDSEPKGYEILREHWMEALGDDDDFETKWSQALHDGVVAGSAFPEKVVAVAPGAWTGATSARVQGLEIAFRTDPGVYDGRFANLGWLQELPRPLTKLTWDNAALMSPNTAEKLGGFRTEETGAGHVAEVVELRYRGRAVKAPVWILPGHPDDSVTVHLGFGRTRAGRVGDAVGFDAYALRTSDERWFGGGLEVERTGDTMPMACTQDHWTIENAPHEAAADRHLVRSATLEEVKADPHVFEHMGHEPDPSLSMHPDHEYPGRAWGMAIDLSACMGCNACVIACQSENNIPVVGKEQVGRGREMHWIRIDRYFEGDAGRARHLPPAGALHALREGALRGGLPGGGHRPQRRRPQRHGLQPLRRHAVLLEQLPLQGAALQLLPLPGLGHADPQDDAQPRRHGAHPRGHGEVHLLRAAHQPGPHRRQERGPRDPRRRDPDRLPAGLPDPGDRLRRPQRSREPGVEAEGQPPQLRPALRAAARGRGPRTSPSVRNPNPEIPSGSERGAPWLARPTPSSRSSGRATPSPRSPTRSPALVLRKKTPNWWFVGLAVAFGLLQLLLMSVALLLVRGVGIWGINVPVGWGFAIINFVWWIGIGHAGTLISAILLLLRQDWRTSINRFAEAMTLFAVACAGLFPLSTWDGPGRFYWLMPYPNTMGLWPQFRSPLIWDVFAVSTYATVSRCSGTSG